MTRLQMRTLTRRDVAVLLALSLAALGACAMRRTAAPPAPLVRPGISVLMTDSIHLIRGRRVGLITNQTGVDEHGESDIERLRSAEARAAGAQLVRLFSPEHGIRGTEDREQLASGIDERSGLFIQSLYANGTIGPPDSTLRDLDVLVVDLQDIGTRTWTYVGATLYAMRAAARRGIPIVVLDRPNPLSGLNPDGPILDSALANPNEPTASRPGRAYALYPTPLRHALTMGELARYFNAELKIGARLHVVPAAGWRRAMWFDETGLPWVRPSPNLPTLASATVYPALVPFEGSSATTSPRVRQGTASIPGRRFRECASSSRTATATRRDGRRQPFCGPSGGPRGIPSSCATRCSTNGSAGRRCGRRSCAARTPIGSWRGTARPSRRGGVRWRDTGSIDKSLPSWASHVSCTEGPRQPSIQPDREPNP
jgi:uncharacterized protein YbbC (DUF1343 family)